MKLEYLRLIFNIYNTAQLLQLNTLCTKNFIFQLYNLCTHIISIPPAHMYSQKKNKIIPVPHYYYTRATKPHYYKECNTFIHD